jgi:hypothetical protein
VKTFQIASCLALPALRALASSGEPLGSLEDACPSTLSIEIGNERSAVPVA